MRRRLKRTPLGAGQQRSDVALDVDGIAGIGESEPPCQAGHMGVHWQTGNPEADAQDHVRSLPPYTRQGDQLFDPVRDLATEVFIERGAETYEAPRLRAEEAGGMDQRLELGRIGVTEIGWCRIALEDLRSDQVDLFVGGLRRQHCRDQKLERGCEVECAQLLGGARVHAGQEGGGLPGPAFRGSWSGHGLQGTDSVVQAAPPSCGGARGSVAPAIPGRADLLRRTTGSSGSAGRYPASGASH